MGHLNVEIKARCGNKDSVRSYLLAHKADYKGLDHQIDTYFKVASGRLKLREGNIENYLIHYERSNQEGPKESQVILYNSKPGSALKEVLTKALGVLVVVDKQREIYFIDNVKFHIDTIVGLGGFVEIEAIDEDGTIGRKKLHEQCSSYLAGLGIKDDELVSVSYSDLLMVEDT